MPTAFHSSLKNDFHSARANELRQMEEILLRHRLIRDAGPLLSAATTCQGNKDVSYYKYEIPHLLFPDLPKGMMHHARPQNAEAGDFTIDLKVDLCGVVPDESILEDPFTYLVVDIFIGGQVITNDGDVRDLKCAWHLDRHEESSTPAGR